MWCEVCEVQYRDISIFPLSVIKPGICQPNKIRIYSVSPIQKYSGNRWAARSPANTGPGVEPRVRLYRISLLSGSVKAPFSFHDCDMIREMFFLF